MYATQVSSVTQLREHMRPQENVVISFSEDDMTHITSTLYDNLMTVEIDRFDMRRILWTMKA